MPDFPANRQSPAKNAVRRITLVVVAVGAILFAYGIAGDRETPYSAQGLVQAYLVRIAPEVAGKVTEVGVRTDQRVNAGTVLFRIDPDAYALAVRRAEAKLEAAGQSIGASTAAVASAQAKLADAVSKRENAREQTGRIFELVKKGVYAQARQQQAQTTLDSAEAVVSQAQAEVEKAQQTLGPQGKDNPQIREAMGALEQANFDLTRTTIVAPSDGGVTNLSLAVGQVLGKGEAAMTYIDLREVWIEAAFRENSLESIKVGDPVEIVLDILPGRVLAGKVGALGYGVGNRSVDVRTGLPSPRSQSGWIRTPQPMPVRIEFDRETRPLRVGSQASVMVYPSDNAIMNAIGRFRMRLVALLTYVH
ncbi:HlyD family secretion protein [Methylobacterium sp. Leaf89]|uniref:HlyD family secretion protein n=1 Tax=Methylobacterium sp. Leaf89 TaxID=1736245 RepID=UPI001FCDA8FE|nr:HlyD family secretion protein [Methylobacterium sp. Leaf89]